MGLRSFSGEFARDIFCHYGCLTAAPRLHPKSPPRIDARGWYAVAAGLRVVLACPFAPWACSGCRDIAHYDAAHAHGATRRGARQNSGQ
jgi:hypothetical protein